MTILASLRFSPRNYSLLISTFLLVLRLALSPADGYGQSLAEKLKTKSVTQLAEEARKNGDAIAGAIIFTRKELSCTRCHETGRANPIGPDLRSLPQDVTDAYLVESLLEPSKSIREGFDSVRLLTKAGTVRIGRVVEDADQYLILQDMKLPESAGEFEQIRLEKSEIQQISPSQTSTMPDNLVDQLKNRQEFLDLIRFLMELSDVESNRVSQQRLSGGKSLPVALQGVVMLKEFNCAACHQDDISNAFLSGHQAPDLRWSAGRIDPHFITRFIADPLAVKPGTTMPNVMSHLSLQERDEAALEITHYLASLSERPFVRQTLDPESVERGNEIFHSVGCVACHSPRGQDGQPLLEASSQSLETVDAKYNLEGLVTFLEDPLRSRPAGRMPNMKLSHWEAVDVASYLLSRRDGGTGTQPFSVDAVLVSKGELRFRELGCVQCHQVDAIAVQSESVALSNARSDHGCLSGQPGSWPVFDMATAQMSTLKAALDDPPGELTAPEQIGVTLTAFRCTNCHQRGELGGVSMERNPHFKAADPNLGPQGRLPPALTGVGAKLKPRWMRQVLVSGRAIRPYVLTRMPQYGTENISHLIRLFKQVDKQTSQVPFAVFEDEKEIRKVGHELAGASGLNCIACHTFQLKQAANMSAVDLTDMAERLQKPWFYRFMRNPQQFSPNIIMPSFWPAGRAVRRDVLNGEADQQIEALWQYLLEGRQARAPRGLIREPMDLVAADEAVMLRRAYPGIGKRGIGVGYPSQVNLAYDAEQMRLAMIWQGKFADPSGVWRSQGHGRVRLLGEKPIEFLPGPDLDHARNPWVVDEGRPPDHQFKGYTLDEARRPRFKYEFMEMRVEDYSVDGIDASSKRPFLRREVRIESNSEYDDIVFRAASGSSIQKIAEHVFQVDERLRVHVDGGVIAKVIDGQESQQLIIPLVVAAGETALTLEYRW